MKKLFSSILLVAGFIQLNVSLAQSFPRKLEAVPYVDVSRYLGNWYQISHRPLFFEGIGECPCARQQLTLLDNGSVGVYNSCNKKSTNGKLREIRGVATSLDPQSNAKFNVDFNLPWKGSYWVVGIDPSYRFAVVSDKYAYSVYILSKTPEMSEDLYQEALKIATEKNLPVDKLKFTTQAGCTYPN